MVSNTGVMAWVHFGEVVEATLPLHVVSAYLKMYRILLSVA